MPAGDTCVINRVASGVIQTLLLVRTVAYQGHSGSTRSPEGPNIANLRPLPTTAVLTRPCQPPQVWVCRAYDVLNAETEDPRRPV